MICTLYPLLPSAIDCAWKSESFSCRRWHTEKLKGRSRWGFESRDGSTDHANMQAKFQGLVRAANLGARPIEDPFLEKDLADRGYEYLVEHLCLNQCVHAQELKSRIIEIYRKCYERSPTNPESVITDFVAVYPQLSFESGWLRELVETQAGNRDFRRNGPRNRLFRAIAAGFRRVANPAARVHRSIRDARLEAARYSREAIEKDLNEWEKSLERRTGASEWIREQAIEKVKQLTASDSRLKCVETRLTQFLCKAQLYNATNLILSKLYGVPVRELETRRRP